MRNKIKYINTQIDLPDWSKPIAIHCSMRRRPGRHGRWPLVEQNIRSNQYVLRSN